MNTKQKRKAGMEAAVVGLAGALLFMLLHIPLPWILGPLTAVMVWRLSTGRTLYWPTILRSSGLIVLGSMLGAAFTHETVVQIIQQLPYMAASTIATVIFSLSLGAWVAYRTGLTLPSGVFGSVPGGLSQMLVLSEEVEEVDATVVAFMQTIRVMSVIFAVPFLTIHGIGAEQAMPIASSSGGTGNIEGWTYALYAVIALGGAWIGRKIGLPTSVLTGPLLATACCAIFYMPAPPLPHIIILLSQFAIGVHIGLQMKPHMLGNVKKLGGYTITSSLLLILFSLLIAWLLTKVSSMTLSTAFLSTAPGGIAEMGVTAAMVHADLSMVSGYQLFRVFFVIFAVPSMLTWWMRRLQKRKTSLFE